MHSKCVSQPQHTFPVTCTATPAQHARQVSDKVIEVDEFSCLLQAPFNLGSLQYLDSKATNILSKKMLCLKTLFLSLKHAQSNSFTMLFSAHAHFNVASFKTNLSSDWVTPINFCSLVGLDLVTRVSKMEKNCICMHDL